MRTIVVGILYPKVKEFIDDYINAINSQSLDGFEVILFDNNYGNYSDVVSKFKVPVKVFSIGVEYDSIIPVRQFILDTLKKEENVENVIFTDSDDYFDSDRFEVLVNGLKDKKIVFTNLSAVDKEGNDLGREFIPEGVVEVGFNMEVDKHLVGFGHSAIKWELLEKVWPYTNDLIVGDWWFFMSLFSQGYTATKVDGTKYYYRQHGSNLVGMKKEFSSGEVLRAVNVKIALYKNLLKYLDGEKKEIISKKLDNVLLLKKKLNESSNRVKYLDNINDVDRNWLWWEWVDLKWL